MANPPDDGPDDPRGDGNDPSGGQNPFKGTPFEHLFGAMGGLGGAGGPGGPSGPGGAGMPDLSALFGGGQMPDLSQIMAQVQSLMQPYDGPVNWDVVLDAARKQVAAQPDPTPTPRQKEAVADALRLADLWLDETTDFGSGVTATAAWSRAEWLVGTLDVWKHLVEPIAASANGALGKALPAEAAQMAGPLIGMLGKVTGAMVGGQVAGGLGALATEVLTASDIGLPLGPVGTAAILPANVSGLAEGLDVSDDDVLLYLALREAAHQRLFAHVPWLREHLLGAVRDYGQGLEINTEQIQSTMEERLRGIDPTNPAAMQEMLEGGLFDLEQSPAQQAALERLEVTLALVEGWVDEVVGQATGVRMPAAAKLQEAVRRRRAAGGPAEQTFASLVGLELRPRRLRDASTLWGSLRTRQGTEARDGVWMHPDLLPTAADLDDPLGFREDATAPESLSAEEFDAELQALLDGPADEGTTDEGTTDEGPTDDGPAGDGPTGDRPTG